MNGEIYSLIGKAMDEIGAIGKDSYNPQQKFKYRGIDAVMNALNPVMRKYGLFVTPEVLDHKREERQSASGGRLIYSILTMKYTMYAPDGSNISSVVIGEGMDSGDKASNKAMSVAMKYAMFQLFCIPTEEMVDPDSESFPESKPVSKPVDRPAWDVITALTKKAAELGLTPERFDELRRALIKAKVIEYKTNSQLDPVDVENIVEAIRANFPGEVKAA